MSKTLFCVTRKLKPDLIYCRCLYRYSSRLRRWFQRQASQLYRLSLPLLVPAVQSLLHLSITDLVLETLFPTPCVYRCSPIIGIWHVRGILGVRPSTLSDPHKPASDLSPGFSELSYTSLSSAQKKCPTITLIFHLNGANRSV